MPSRSEPTRAWAALLAVAVLGGSRVSRAGDKATADALFRAGKELMDVGQLDEACPKLQASMEEDPLPVTLLNLALCHEKQGRTATAWTEYTDAASLAKQRDERGRAEVAKEFADKLVGRLSRVTLRVERPVAGLAIDRSGQPVQAAALGVAVAIDPGRYSLRATAPGHRPWTRELEVPPGPADLTVSIPPLEPTLAGVPVPPGPPGPPGPPPAPTDEDAPGNALLHAGIALGTVGAVGLGIGGLFGGLAMGKRDRADPFCPDRSCDDTGLDLVSEARTFAHASTATFVVGGAALASGLALVVAGLADDTPTDAVALVPVCSPGECGLRIGGAF